MGWSVSDPSGHWVRGQVRSGQQDGDIHTHFDTFKVSGKCDCCLSRTLEEPPSTQTLMNHDHVELTSAGPDKMSNQSFSWGQRSDVHRLRPANSLWWLDFRFLAAIQHTFYLPDFFQLLLFKLVTWSPWRAWHMSEFESESCSLACWLVTKIHLRYSRRNFNSVNMNVSWSYPSLSGLSRQRKQQ